MTYRTDHQQANMRSRMESYTAAEHEAAWGDGPEEKGDDGDDETEA